MTKIYWNLLKFLKEKTLDNQITLDADENI